MNSITIDNVTIVLSHPLEQTINWVGQAEPMRQLLACWHIVAPEDLPLTPRIIGQPGIGKTTLGIAAAKERNQPIYIMQCTSDTRPEDLIITPVLSDKGTISYHASPLLSAVITGGIVIVDEGNRMSEKSWASLASLFDNRQMVESIIAGITVKAHPDFRAAITMNDDSSTFEIPDYIMSRLQPGIRVPFPSREDELRILSYNLPFSGEEILDLCVNFLQKAHDLDLDYSLRDGINIIRYALKLKACTPGETHANLFGIALQQILGDDALDLERQALKRRASGETLPSMNLGDFFFDNDDELNPDGDGER